MALLLALAAPMVSWDIRVASLAVSQIGTLVSLILVALASLSSGCLPLTRISLLPLSLAAACVGSGVANAQAGAFDSQSPWPWAMRFVSSATIPWLVVRCSGELTRQQRRMLLLLALGALTVLTQPLTGYPNPTIVEEGQAVQRFGGLFGHPNFASYTLALGIVFLVASGSLTRMRTAAVGLAVAAILMAGSLTALAGLVIVLILLTVGNPRRAAQLAGLALCAFVFFGQTLSERLDFLRGEGSQRNSGTWRVDHWRDVLDLVQAPNWFGVGYQHTALLMRDGLSAHNQYIQLYVELGLLGCVMVGLGALAAVRGNLRHRVVWGSWLYVGLTSAADPVLVYPSTLALLMLLTAMASPVGVAKACSTGADRARTEKVTV